MNIQTDQESPVKKPLIAVYGIYKNEDRCMSRFLASIKTADEIVLCDTGSTDQTNIIIKLFKERNVNVPLKVYRIYQSPWRFDDARNVALSLVSPNIDICISLDIDEFLMENWKSHLMEQWEEGVTKYYHKFHTMWVDGSVSEHFHERIHVRNGYTWKLPVHEILDFSGEENIKTLPDFWIYHEPEVKETRTGYLSLLKQSVKENKYYWKSWSFLAIEYSKQGKYDKAMDALDSALQIKDCDRAFLYRQKYSIYKHLDKSELALNCLNTAILELPDRRELYVEKAKYLSRIGRNMEAHSTLIEAASKNEKIEDYLYNRSAWGESFEKLQLKTYKRAKKEGMNL